MDIHWSTQKGTNLQLDVMSGMGGKNLGFHWNIEEDLTQTRGPGKTSEKKRPFGGDLKDELW